MERLIGYVLTGTGAVMAIMATAQTLPGETSAGVGPVRYVCAAEMETDGGRFYARREVDAMGRVAAETVQWIEGTPGEIGRWLTVWIDWPKSDGRDRFDQGIATFHFDTDRSWNQSVKFNFAAPGAPPLAASAEPKAAHPSTVAATVPVVALLRTMAASETIDLSISGPTAKQRKGPPILGRYSLGALRKAQASMPRFISNLEAAQGDFRNRCIATSASILAKAR
jgi:hypothetical protein